MLKILFHDFPLIQDLFLNKHTISYKTSEAHVSGFERRIFKLGFKVGFTCDFKPRQHTIHRSMKLTEKRRVPVKWRKPKEKPDIPSYNRFNFKPRD